MTADHSNLASICIQACQDMFDQTVVDQRVATACKENIPGMVTTPVVSFKHYTGFLEFRLKARLFDMDGLKIRIFNEELEEEVVFDNYDENIPSINVYASESVLSKIVNAGVANTLLVTNLKWLINRTQSTFEQYGHKLSIPSNRPSFDESSYDFPEGIVPTPDQRQAVKTVLNSSLSYVWGAPGTGKTQLVLATSIMAYLKKGKRVLVIAPTNLAVEQVLRGILNVIENDRSARRYVDSRRDVIRMGVATAGFYKDYPYVCERKNATAEISKIKEKIEKYQLLLKERSIQALRPRIDALIRLGEEKERAGFLNRRGIEKKIRSAIQELKSLLRIYPEYSSLLDYTNEDNILSEMYAVKNRLYNRSIPVLTVPEFASLSDDDVWKLIKQCNAEIQDLKDDQSTAKMDSSKIIAMTPHTLMLYRNRFFSDEPSIHVNHVFVDEAGYANLLQMLPVFMVGAPVTFLGDHKQLAPVCHLDSDDVKTWYERNDQFMHYSFMWAMPALYSEYVLTGDFDHIAQSYFNKSVPDFKITATAALTESHRFGSNLADILDRCIYNNGIKGLAKDPLSIEILDAECEVQGKTNEAEVEAIADYISKNKKRLGSFVILTPYNLQVQALKNRLGGDYKDDILTVHKSQGREWDTVILSVRDNEYTSQNLTFTSTISNIDGARVINTAVSRAKKTLVIVCDKRFWSTKVSKNELIRNLIISADKNQNL